MMKKCKKCGSDLPNRIIIDGHLHNIKGRKFCLKCSPWMGHNTKKIIYDKVDGMNYCPKCKTSKSLSSFYKRKAKRGPSYQTYCKKCHNEIRNDRKRDRKIKAINLMGGKCQKCGYDKYIEAMDFHHIKGKDKEFIGAGIQTKNWSKVVKELKKCVLLCCRCHREEHNSKDHSMNTKSHSDAMLNMDIKPTGKCPVCNTDVYGTKLCSEVCRIANRLAKRPSKTDLINDMISMNKSEIGRKYEVSNVTVSKWIKAFGLD